MPRLVEGTLTFSHRQKGPSLPTHVEILYWNGHFRYADELELTTILDPRMNKVEYYHPWGLWNQFDCYAEINVELIGTSSHCNHV